MNLLSDDNLDNEVFNKVYQLKSNTNWKEINSFMKNEYKYDWDKFIGEVK